MLDGIKRWLKGASPAPPKEWEGIEPWAESHGYGYRVVQGEGFVVDGRLGDDPWRMEWGPSQRPYLQGQELRLRSEMGLGAELQLVVMNRPLQEQMERSMYEQYVEGVQTRIDNQTPPEMRWLVMFPKLSGSEMGALRDRYAALASQKEWLTQWLAGPLGPALQALRIEPGVPIVLMIGRGRLMLRTALDDTAVPMLQMWLRLFETAMREARRVCEARAGAASQSPQASGWSPSALPGDERN
jgi:hypothetical protein